MTPQLTFMQLQVLGILADEGARTIARLADDLLISDSSARSAVGALERRGLVSRDYTSGSRAFVVHATRKGVDLSRVYYDTPAEVDETRRPAWGDLPYDRKTPAEVVHDYAVVRGDLGEQYARDQLAGWIERYADAKCGLLS